MVAAGRFSGLVGGSPHMQEEAPGKIDAGLRAGFHDDNAVAAQVRRFGLELAEPAIQAGSAQAGKLA
jgi:hypothetical protein